MLALLIVMDSACDKAVCIMVILVKEGGLKQLVYNTLQLKIGQCLKTVNTLEFTGREV